MLLPPLRPAVEVTAHRTKVGMFNERRRDELHRLALAQATEFMPGVHARRACAQKRQWVSVAPLVMMAWSSRRCPIRRTVAAVLTAAA